MRSADDRSLEVLAHHVVLVPEDVHWPGSKIKNNLSGAGGQCTLAIVFHTVTRKIPQALDKRIERRAGTITVGHHWPSFYPSSAHYSKKIPVLLSKKDLKVS